MRSISLPAAAALALLTAAVSPAAAQIGSGREVMRTILETLAICGPTGLTRTCGPVYVDLATFRERLGPHVTDSASAAEWFGVPVRNRASSRVYRCWVYPRSKKEYCTVLHNGIHLQVDSVRAEGEEMRVYVTHSWARGAGVPGAGMMSHWFLFTREDDRWVALEAGQVGERPVPEGET